MWGDFMACFLGFFCAAAAIAVMYFAISAVVKRRARLRAERVAERVARYVIEQQLKRRRDEA